MTAIFNLIHRNLKKNCALISAMFLVFSQPILKGCVSIISQNTLLSTTIEYVGVEIA